MARLENLISGLEVIETSGDLDKEIKGVQYDSRKIEPGYLFVCIPGFKVDGHDYVLPAVGAGAIALLVEKPVAGTQGVTVVRVKDTRKALPIVASNFYGAPSRQLRLIGVTGTNGKTTTTHLITSVLEEAGYQVGILGTLYARWRGKQESMAHTTPESVDLERFIRRVVDEGGDYTVMEVSSHALDLGRVDCLDFDAAVFTNLTQDHLDYHRTMDDYREAKLKLFRRLKNKDGHFAVINRDDPSWTVFRDATPSRVVTYGITDEAAVRATEVRVEPEGSCFTLKWPEGDLRLSLNLSGWFNVSNALAAAAFALKEGISPEVIKRGLEKVSGIPGRFETVKCGQDFTVIVDYAHTPDGLENILKTARAIAKKRIITVFGCGGDRDRGKRPLMGKIAAECSDFSIITSDNPRSEDPLAIIEDIVTGVKKVPNSRYTVIADRRVAIGQAINMAQAEDMVIIAGKGHETYQLLKDEVLPFDDREVAKEFIKERLQSVQ
ncbi:UDP-N-acetylmuramoyl-L-alanyl-D-glutamate--2,6-diaminopimelate ligase [Syntrophothermus lipocalidus]|uniref:UDP-N-acetylmuramoyl-L-alanyl-D-glutamate--2,6-diaminopimelate ligase n=1 Tax=Syntrophothermus lipocalidus (strain DSM 12680 / TGB-C1) TaxID=643648 RepID=D7CLI5_SYNLT|nr:UDP-N-acetylmuramoyl-L-alanyl-D-glutamate--2,6-diaminopimelate ligase [Syntrophothermus lipocalidus]ADI01570.1 UDP-N-acetylmuramyl-tripeptide synthetase [Syntrophothermus lipocalidus DSM 12680]